MRYRHIEKSVKNRYKYDFRCENDNNKQTTHILYLYGAEFVYYSNNDWKSNAENPLSKKTRKSII